MGSYKSDLETTPKFGAGFNTETGEPKRSPYELQGDTPFSPPFGGSDDFDASVLTESATSSATRHLDVSLALRYYSFGVNASYSHDAFSSTRHDEVTWIISVFRRWGKWESSQAPKLTKEAEAMLATGDGQARFRRVYGDHYVAAYLMSSRVELTYTYSLDDTADNKDMAAAANMFVDAFMGKSEISANVTEKLRATRTTSRLKYTVKANGVNKTSDIGAILEVDPLDVPALRKALAAYLKQAVVQGQAAPYEFETMPHPDLELRDALPPDAMGTNLTDTAFNCIAWSVDQTLLADRVLSDARYDLGDAQRLNIQKERDRIVHTSDELRRSLRAFFVADKEDAQVSARDRVQSICDQRKVAITLPDPFEWTVRPLDDSTASAGQSFKIPLQKFAKGTRVVMTVRGTVWFPLHAGLALVNIGLYINIDGNRIGTLPESPTRTRWSRELAEVGQMAPVVLERDHDSVLEIYVTLASAKANENDPWQQLPLGLQKNVSVTCTRVR